MAGQVAFWQIALGVYHFRVVTEYLLININVKIFVILTYAYDAKCKLVSG